MVYLVVRKQGNWIKKLKLISHGRPKMRAKCAILVPIQILRTQNLYRDSFLYFPTKAVYSTRHFLRESLFYAFPMIELQQVIPHPLKSLGIRADSTVLATHCQFQKGKEHLILAPSGKGKSTLLHILYGLRKDWDGDVLWDGDSIRSWSTEEWTSLRREQCSMVYQDLRLFQEQTAFDNIRINRDLAPRWDDDQIRAHAHTLGVDHLLETEAGKLSYGQRQRIAILRALSQRFSWLFLDEPFSHLDADNTQMAMQLIRETAQEQAAAILLVSLGEDYGLTEASEYIL